MARTTASKGLGSPHRSCLFVKLALRTIVPANHENHEAQSFQSFLRTSSTHHPSAQIVARAGNPLAGDDTEQPLLEEQCHGHSEFGVFSSEFERGWPGR